MPSWRGGKSQAIKNGSVWELNPLGALFKPPTGFEDQGPHQRCKHSQGRMPSLVLQVFRRFPVGVANCLAIGGIPDCFWRRTVSCLHVYRVPLSVRRWRSSAVGLMSHRSKSSRSVRICPVFGCGHFHNLFDFSNLFRRHPSTPDTNRTVLKIDFLQNQRSRFPLDL